MPLLLLITVPECTKAEEKMMRGNLLHIIFHGTTREKAEKILVKGFKPHTYFAKDLEEALEHGDGHVFEVLFEHKYAPEWFENFRCWQLKNKNRIPPSKIITLRKYSRKELFADESIRDEVGRRNIKYYNRFGRYQ